MADFSVRLRSKAVEDVRRIRSWYRAIEPVLEERFLDELNETLDRIQDYPFSYQILYRNTRRALLDKFPYGIFYLIQEPKIIVLAVIHHKRNPALARKRSE